MWGRNYLLLNSNLFSASKVDWKCYFFYIFRGIHLSICLQIFFFILLFISGCMRLHRLANVLSPVFVTCKTKATVLKYAIYSLISILCVRKITLFFKGKQRVKLGQNSTWIIVGIFFVHFFIIGRLQERLKNLLKCWILILRHFWLK